MFICAPIVVSWIVGRDDSVFQRWLEYWVMHFAAHVVEMERTGASGEALERFVEQYMQGADPQKCEFAQAVKEGAVP